MAKENNGSFASNRKKKYIYIYAFFFKRKIVFFFWELATNWCDGLPRSLSFVFYFLTIDFFVFCFFFFFELDDRFFKEWCIMVLDNRLIMVLDFYGPINNKHYLYVFTIIVPMNNMACGIINWMNCVT